MPRSDCLRTSSKYVGKKDPRPKAEHCHKEVQAPQVCSCLSYQDQDAAQLRSQARTHGLFSPGAQHWKAVVHRRQGSLTSEAVERLL